jgi:hypothetical protein
MRVVMRDSPVLGSFTHIGTRDGLRQWRVITEACGAFTETAYRYTLVTSIRNGLALLSNPASARDAELLERRKL